VLYRKKPTPSLQLLFCFFFREKKERVCNVVSFFLVSGSCRFVYERYRRLEKEQKSYIINMMCILFGRNRTLSRNKPIKQKKKRTTIDRYFTFALFNVLVLYFRYFSPGNFDL
jgi:hypothetical protein